MKTAAVSWLATFGIAITTGIAGLLVGGWFANKAASWYQVPAREGGQGYFILFLALGAGVAAFVVGLIITRLLSSMADVTVVRAFVAAQATVLLLILLVAGISRVQADVPPSVGGKDLMLALEFLWPVADVPKFSADTITPQIVLYSSAGSGAAYGRRGPLWVEKSRTEGDRVIVPGVVEVYTSRGKRIVALHTNGDSANSFVVPLRGYPRASDQKWSEWKPIAPGEASHVPSYRFRVIKRNEPLRTDTVGPFTLEMFAESFEYQEYDYRPTALQSKSSYRIRYNGAPIPTQAVRLAPDSKSGSRDPEKFETINAVAVVPGASPALVLQVDEGHGPGAFCLLKVVSNQPVCEYMGGGIYRTFAHEMIVPTSSADTPATKTLWALNGSYQPSLLQNSALYVFPECVLDARTQTVHPIPREAQTNALNWVAPVGLSPDGKQFAQLAGDQGQPDLAVITIANGARREISVRNAPSPTGEWTNIDHTWFDNYFRWETGPNGEYDVRPLPNALTMPHRGRLKQEPGYRQYDLSPVDSAMREAIAEFIVQEMGGTRASDKAGGYAVDVNTKEGAMSVGFTDHQASVFMSRGTNTLNVATFAKKFDQALATRRYDSHFLMDQPK